MNDRVLVTTTLAPNVLQDIQGAFAFPRKLRLKSTASRYGLEHSKCAGSKCNA